MQPVSDAFLAEIRKSHEIVSYVDVLTSDNRTFRLDAVDGDVTIDRTADVRRSCSVSCVDPDGTLTPTSAESILTPHGTLLKLYRGVKYKSGPLAGSEEVVPLGVFWLSKADVKDQVGGSTAITLDGYDFSRNISRAKFIDPYTIAVGYSVIQAIKDIINLTFPDVEFDVFNSSLTLNSPQTFDASSDPWAACQALATSAGCEVFFTATGGVKIAPPVDIDHLPAPVFTYDEGEDCTMLDLDVVFSDDPGFNGVVLVGESAGDDTPPVRSVLWDDQPSSPTYYLGPYGKVPMFIQDQTVTTQEEADTAAASQLNLILGFSSQLEITATVNPALDANDVVGVIRARSGINAKYALDSLKIPLGVNGTSGLSLRRKRTTA